MPVILKIDITTGDKITYKEIKYTFDLMLEDRKIQVWSYNVETVIAEKFESIINRGTLGTIKKWKEVIEVLRNSDTMKRQWERYQNDNFYAEDIDYDDLITSLIKVGELL